MTITSTTVSVALSKRFSGSRAGAMTNETNAGPNEATHQSIRLPTIKLQPMGTNC
jgi:hypothetical protein